MKLAAALVLCLALSSCAPRTLRQSICFMPQQGVQVCQFAYDGDEKPAD